jgi:hypothetical protein
VAHSLGGLVTEEALCWSRNSAEKHIQQVGSSVTGIVFLGTPHFGSDLAAWAKLATSIARIAKQANSDLVSVLSPGSEVLAKIQKGFHNLLRLRQEDGTELSLTCFYEELPLPVVGEVFIPLSSNNLLSLTEEGGT